MERDELPLRPSGGVTFSSASPDDKRILPRWVAAIREDSNPKRRDAVELAGMAFKKWLQARRHRSAAVTLSDFKDMIEDNPNSEVTVLLVAKIRKPRGRLMRSQVAGLCAFHRTWANNIFLDFLCVDPRLYGEHAPVRGIGSATLWYLALLAGHIDANMIWGEATQNSCGFYSKVFAKDVRDLIQLSPDEYTRFAVEMKARSQRS